MRQTLVSGELVFLPCLLVAVLAKEPEINWQHKYHGQNTAENSGPGSPYIGDGANAKGCRDKDKAADERYKRAKGCSLFVGQGLLNQMIRGNSVDPEEEG